MLAFPCQNSVVLHTFLYISFDSSCFFSSSLFFCSLISNVLVYAFVEKVRASAAFVFYFSFFKEVYFVGRIYDKWISLLSVFSKFLSLQNV